MRLDIHRVTFDGITKYLGFKEFDTPPNDGDTIHFMNHEYRVLDSCEYYLCVKLIN